MQALANAPLREGIGPQDYDSSSDDCSDSSSGTVSTRKSAASTTSSISARSQVSIVEQKRNQMIDKLMAQFYAVFHPWLEAVFGIECYECDQIDSSGYNRAGCGVVSCGTGNPGGRSGGPGRSLAGSKRQQRDSSDGEDDGDCGDDDGHCRGNGGGGSGNGGGGGGRRNGNKRARRDSGNHGKKFACPYYKNDPERFRDKRTCCGPGWDSVHRLK